MGRITPFRKVGVSGLKGLIRYRIDKVTPCFSQGKKQSLTLLNTCRS